MTAKPYAKNEGDEPGAGAVGSTCTTTTGRAGVVVAGADGAPVCRPNDSDGPVPA